MLRVVADTNIYISALNFGGVPDRLFALARRGKAVSTRVTRIKPHIIMSNRRFAKYVEYWLWVGYC